MTTYDFLNEPRGAFFKALLDASSKLASHFGLVLQPYGSQWSSEANELMTKLEPHLILNQDVSSWPGTQLASGFVYQRNLYRVNGESIAALLDVADGLFDFVGPALLEDLHFLRADGSVLLGTLAQEGVAWMELNEDELILLNRTAPGLSDLLGIPHKGPTE
jgi:hypothetical protein